MSTKKLKILQAVYCLGRGGAEKLAVDITYELNKREDVDVMLLSFHKTVDYEYDTTGLNYKYYPSDTKLSVFGKNKLFADNYRKILSDFKPDIIHSHRFLTELITRFDISENTKYFTHCHDNIKQFQKIKINSLVNKERLTNLYERHFLFKKYHQCNNNFIAISNDSVYYLKGNLPFSLRKNIYLMNNAVDIQKYDDKNRLEKQNERLKRPSKNHIIRLINVGSLCDNKNQIFLLNVIAILRDKGYNISLELLGEGQNRKFIEQQILNLGLSGIAFCRGNVNNVPDYLHNSDIFLHAAKHEAFGLVLIEAMAAGLPVVCLDGKGNRDIIEEGKNGFMVYEHNPELFADKIIELINNKDLYNSISKYAVEFAQKYDIKEYVDKLLTLYRSV